ncbi:MAG: glycosyltransferase [Anaerolineales bacterium]|nr:glycosyltransferase [Anaerolineales bacterium]
MTAYRVPPGVAAIDVEGTSMLTTPEGGRVVVDQALLALWRAAAGHTLAEVLAAPAAAGRPPGSACAALASLAEAGLLARDGAPEPPSQPAAPAAAGPLVSALIVAYNSRAWLVDCLPSLAAQTYPSLEVIVVDNASTDGVSAWLAEAHPAVQVLRLETAVSLAAAINRGAELAAGDLLILNPDIRLAPTAVVELAAVAQARPNCGAVAALLKFTWAPRFLNGLGNYVRDHSWGSDLGLGHLDLGQFDHYREVPSVCFAAALIPRPAWAAVGPADPGFPMYYEDSEWSYRARLLGYDLAAAPRAVVYHAFGSQVPSGQAAPLPPSKLRRAVYGRWRFALKLLTDGAHQRFTRNYWREDWGNLLGALRRGRWGEVRAYLQAWADVLRDLPALARLRARLAARRRRGMDQVFDQPEAWPAPLEHNGLPRLTWDVIEQHYWPLMRTGRTRAMPEFEGRPPRPHVLIASNDLVAAKMAGPGMRYLELAQALAADCDVTLAVPAATDLSLNDVRVVVYDEKRPLSLPVLADNADVALVSGYMVEKFPTLRRSRARLVVDLYDPFMLENLHYHLKDPLTTQESASAHATSIVNRLAALGDFFICGSERQRDLWMGVLAANGRVNPHTFAADPTLRSLIDVVGIGFPDRPLHTGALLRGVNPAFPPESRIVLWGGGMWDWLDPLTLLKAWPVVAARHPEARLVYLGTKHPNPDVPTHQVVGEAVRLAEAQGMRDQSVFFIEWLAYAEREALLSEADIGVVLHPVHVETRYSIRTRVLDYFWARLPILVTAGDVTSEWVRELGLGRVVPPHDVAAVSAALLAMLAQPKAAYAANFAGLPARFNWNAVAEPLRRYCLTGQPAPDRHLRVTADPPPRGPLRQAAYLWMTEGFRPMLGRAWRYLQLRRAGF